MTNFLSGPTMPLGRAVCATVLLMLFCATSSHALPGTRLLTAGPLFDYRSSSAVDYATLHLAGPLIKWERKSTEHEWALRPLFYRAVAKERDAALVDVLFPLFRYRRDREMVEWNLLSLVRYESQNYPGRERHEYKLFPFLEFTGGDGRPTTHALFPLTGHGYDWFGRAETEYLLFPLWSRTRHYSGMRVDNVLWPFFARISGDDPEEKGFKVWPLTGYASRPGHYEKFFLFWPLWIDYDTRLQTDSPRHERYCFPLWLASDTPQRSERTLLWPFFSRIEDRGPQPYREWNFPWPLLMHASGEYRHGTRVLPFYGDVTTGGSRTRWFLWPVYRIENADLQTIDRTRHSLFYLLYSDLKEQVKEDQTIRLHRRLFWPLFGYQQTGNVRHFYTLALLEPFFPESDGLERNWSPLWRIYQTKWDQQGNRISTLLWNLYWRESGPSGTAWELFPLVFYRNEPETGREWSLLKGLLRYRRTGDDTRLHLFYLPWGIPLGEDPPAVKPD